MYTVVIDESGYTGLSNVQADPSRGPSQYFCMSAVIYRDELASEISNTLEDFVNPKGVVHCAGMDHFKKVHLCQTVAQQPIGILGVISNKLSLLCYLQEAQRSPTHYYNKVSQYLFERIGETVGKLRLPTVSHSH